MQKKPLYIPTEEDIYYLQKLKNNNAVNKLDIYGYLIAKGVEKTINDAKFLRFIDEELIELPGLVHGVCWVYPQEIYNSEYAKYDADLCQKLLTKKKDGEIYNLNNISMFAPSVQYNRMVMTATIDELDKKLINNPEYRFTYSKSMLLDSIFSVDCEQFETLSYSDLSKLISIDPIYALKLDYHGLIREFKNPEEKLIYYRQAVLFQDGLYKYLKLYNISPLCGYDYDEVDMTNPQDEKIKKLIKYLHS